MFLGHYPVYTPWNIPLLKQRNDSKQFQRQYKKNVVTVLDQDIIRELEHGFNLQISLFLDNQA